MTTTQQLFQVSGEKIESLLLGEKSIQLLSKSCHSLEEFQEAWSKKLSLATKTEINYDKISSITKEEGEDHVVIKSGFASEYHITFENVEALESFYSFFQEEKRFSRTEESLSPMKSAMPYIWGLAITLALTGFGYYLSVSPDSDTTTVRKGRWVLALVEMLGTTGVLLVGLGISAYVGYMIWSRFKNPPMHTKLVPVH